MDLPVTVIVAVVVVRDPETLVEVITSDPPASWRNVLAVATPAVAGAGLAARLAGALLRGRERYLLRVVVQGALEAEEHHQEQRGHQEDHLDGH